MYAIASVQIQVQIQVYKFSLTNTTPYQKIPNCKCTSSSATELVQVSMHKCEYTGVYNFIVATLYIYEAGKEGINRVIVMIRLNSTFYY